MATRLNLTPIPSTRLTLTPLCPLQFNIAMPSTVRLLNFLAWNPAEVDWQKILTGPAPTSDKLATFLITTTLPKWCSPSRKRNLLLLVKLEKLA
jgi:hypothetical protein